MIIKAIYLKTNIIYQQMYFWLKTEHKNDKLIRKAYIS